MKIISGYIENFGCLSNKSLSFGGGLNTVCSANGTGKSTLLAFIKAMLFGIGDTKKTSLFENERRRYTPWNKGRFGGSLTVEVSGRRFRIERSFGKRPSEDSFRLFDAVTGLESSEYGETIGEVLLGIDADGAERTVFLTERNLLPTTESPTISAAITGAVGRVNESDKLFDALAILDKQRKKYLKKGGGGEIDLCRENIVVKKRRLSALESLIQAEKTENEEISHITDKLGRLDSRAEGIRNRQNALVTRHGSMFFSLFLIFLLAITLSSLVLGITLNPLFYIAAGVLFILTAVFFILIRGRVNLKTQTDYAKLDYERSDIDSVKVQLIEERAELIRRHEKTLDAVKERDELRAELSMLTARLERLESELFIVKEAAERLKAANDTLAAKHVGGAKEAFKKYLDALCESHGLNLDTELKISRTEGGETHPYESYSRAMRDLYAFAARLAAADAVFGGKCPFLVLDDPFAAFDDKRLSIALCFLRELSRTRQVIYLTPTKSRLPVS